jgi:hypothetical protein
MTYTVTELREDRVEERRRGQGRGMAPAVN